MIVRWGTKSPPGEAGDGTQRQDGVDEGAHEDPEGQLIAEVPDEVPHHPGTELLRCQREGQDGDGEHHAHRRDDRGGDGDEHLATGIRTARLHPRRQGQMVVVRGEIDLECQQEEQPGHDDQQQRDHPQRGLERIPAPSGEPELPAIAVSGGDCCRVLIGHGGPRAHRATALIGPRRSSRDESDSGDPSSEVTPPSSSRYE